MRLLFANGLITVEMNDCNEGFVTHLKSRITIRIGRYDKNLKLTCNANLSPTVLNGCPGIIAWSQDAQ